jgi:hypothetical protein
LRYCKISALFSIKKFSLVRIGNEGIRFGFSIGHSAFGAGVTVTIVETSNVGVKVGMVGRGVMDAVDVAAGSAVRVGVGIGEDVDVTLSITGIGVDCPQAVRRKVAVKRICQNILRM